MTKPTPPKKKNSLNGPLGGVAVIVVVIGFYGGREVCYSLLGKTVIAKITSHARTGRGGILSVNYVFTDAGGQQRHGRGDVPFDQSRSLEQTVSVDYLSGFTGVSRIRGGNQRWIALIVTGYCGLMASVLLGVWWFIKKYGQAPVKLKLEKPVSLQEEIESLTMSRTELIGWWISGLIGAVLIVISLLGKFDIYGYLFVIPGVLGLLISLFVINMQHRAERRRIHNLRKVAKRLNFKFGLLESERFLKSLETFHLMSVGHPVRLSNLMHGKIEGTDIALFDFTHVIGYGNKSRKVHQTVHQTVIWLQRRGIRRTEFALCPEGFWSTAGSWLGHGDINFESHPTFSRIYLLRGDDESAIRELFNDDVLEFYENCSGLTTEGSGNKLLFYRAGVRVDPDEIQPFLNDALRLLSLLEPIRNEGKP